MARSKPTQTCCRLHTRPTPWPGWRSGSRKRRALRISLWRKCVPPLSSGPAHCSGARPRSKPSFLGLHAVSNMPKLQARPRSHCHIQVQISPCPISLSKWKHSVMTIYLLQAQRRKLLQAQFSTTNTVSCVEHRVTPRTFSSELRLYWLLFAGAASHVEAPGTTGSSASTSGEKENCPGTI